MGGLVLKGECIGVGSVVVDILIVEVTDIE